MLSDVTGLLLAWRAGDEGALARLIPLVEQELRRIARGCMAGERPGHTLQATALVNEAYLRLVTVQRVSWQNRAHFLAVVARLMRRVLVDAARAKRYQKRGGGGIKVSLHDDMLRTAEEGPDLLALNEALESLARIDDRRSQIIELRYFGGLTTEETAIALGVSVETVMRDSRLAKAWLARALAGTNDDDA